MIDFCDEVLVYLEKSDAPYSYISCTKLLRRYVVDKDIVKFNKEFFGSVHNHLNINYMLDNYDCKVVSRESRPNVYGMLCQMLFNNTFEKECRLPENLVARMILGEQNWYTRAYINEFK